MNYLAVFFAACHTTIHLHRVRTMHALKSAPLRKQHESLRKHIAALKKYLNPLLLAQNASEVRRGLTQLYGEFAQHLQHEAKELYPPSKRPPQPSLSKRWRPNSALK